MKRKIHFFRSKLILAPLFLLAALFAGGINPASAADVWPEKQVELINPFPAGGAADIHEGIGLSGMRERLLPVDGTLRLRMSPVGFTVTVEVPPRRAGLPCACRR